MLELKGIKKNYGNFNALSGVDLQIGEGMIYGLVGPNGAGKTTMIKIICGLLYPDEGTILFDGEDALRDRKKRNALIGYVPDFFGTYDNLTVQEYMLFFAGTFDMHGLVARKRCAELLELVGLSDRLDFLVDSLSRGMQQRLCLARALIYDPKYIIMDEPTNGLDPRSRFEFRMIMQNLVLQGKSIFISSHILPELAEMCTDIGILERGKMILSGDILEVMEQIQASNPIKIKVLDKEELTLNILRKDARVNSVTRSGREFMIRFHGDARDEAELLQSLMSAEISVVMFAREQASLEAVFMQITDHKEEKVVIQNDY